MGAPSDAARGESSATCSRMRGISTRLEPRYLIPGRAGAGVPLNAGGFARAQELARVLGPVPFSRIYSTHWQRNRQTAAPIAARSGDSLTVIDDVAETVKALRAEPPGATVLVVGH